MDTQQSDTCKMPKDKEHKYFLTVVELACQRVDAEPSVGTGRCPTEISNVPDMSRPMSRPSMSKFCPNILL